MARINLLPWREELRKEREKNFYIGIVVAIACALGVFFLVKLQIDSMISNQQFRNQHLQKEIKAVDKAIAEIKEIKKKKRALLDRMRVIQKFQSTRSDSVRLLDELVKVLPDGVHITNYQQKKQDQSFKGVAQSNARVSAFMRNIDRSQWIKSPNLKVIQSNGKRGDAGAKFSTFTLEAKQIVTKVGEEDK
ncbi:MAG: PilN domain-containing protein [Gammaproteobacteria bacterium]|nr:PilN domain-containing protein [Gammaproteobacteria bacterium]